MTKFVFLAPSGSGKTTIVNHIKKKLPYYHIVKSFTTRLPRFSDESEYSFVSKKEFEDYIKNGFFIEWEIVFSNYYGTPKNEVENKEYLLFNMDIKGLKTIKEKIGNVISIAIFPPSTSVLQSRLNERDSHLERAHSFFIEMKDITNSNIDYFVINNNLNEAVEEVINIITLHEKQEKNMKTIFKLY